MGAALVSKGCNLVARRPISNASAIAQLLRHAGWSPGYSRVKFDIPVEPVAPAGVEVIGWETAALILQLPVGRADWGDVEAHMRLFWRPPAFFKIAGGAGGRDIFPCRPPALSARHHMIKGQILGAAAILAGEAVAQEQVKPGEGGILRWLHILFERDHRRQLHCETGAVHFAVIFLDNINPFKKDRFDRIFARAIAKADSS